VVRVSAAGFSSVDITDLTVTAGTTVRADAQLKVGAMTQSVEVKATAALIESAPSNFTTTLQTRYVSDIPLAGRDIQALVQLIPGITQSSGPSGVLFGFESQFGGFPDPLHFTGSSISANGGQGEANAWYLDGALNSSPMVENVVVNPSPDAVSEFNAVDNGLAAEWGRTSGAVFNVVLKPGTNNVHGDLYEFNRNSFFNATNPFSQRDAQGRPFLEPRINWNDMGGTLGGPVYIPHIYNGRNRTFFFVSYDLSFLHENKPSVVTVPLPSERLGDFSGDPRFAAVCNPSAGVTNCLYDPYTTTGPDSNGLFHRTPFTTPVIPANRIDPLAAFYLSTYPNPNYADPLQQGPSGCKNLCNNYLGAVGSSLTTHNISVKVDHTLSERHKLFAEWLFNPSYYTNFRYPYNGPTAQTQTGVAGSQPYRTIPQIFSLGWTSTFSPTLVNEVRAMFSRQAQIATQNGDAVTSNSQVADRVKGLNFYLFKPFQPVPSVSVGGLGSFGPIEWQNAIQGAQTYTILDNLTKIIGKHTLKTGFMFRRTNFWYIGAWGYNLSFGGGLTSDPVTAQGGTGLAQFLLGATDEFGTYSGTYHDPWATWDYEGMYVQDDYRVTRNFSVNVGLRYDIYGWLRDRHDLIATVNPTGLNPQVPFLGRIDYIATPRHPDRDVYPARKNDLGPRLSFAWTPFGNRKTVVRGGYGIVYSNGSGSEPHGGAQSGDDPASAIYAGYYGDFTGQRPAFRLSGGAPTIPFPDPGGARTSDNQFLGTAPYAFLRGSKDAYVEQWSLYIQRELPANMAVSVGYVGAHGMHLMGDLTRNIDHIPTALRQQLRNNIFNPVPVDPSLGPIYGCPIVSGKAMCAGNLVLRPMPQYQGFGALISMDGFNRYNSFQMKFEKRYSQGLNFIAAYTVQKNIEAANFGSLILNYSTPVVNNGVAGRTSFLPGASSGGVGESRAGASAAPEDPDNRRRYNSLGPDDTPQILNFAVTYELPVGQGKRFLSRSGVADKVLGGWRLIQNWNFQTGVPMFFTGPCNGISCRPNLVGDPAKGRSAKNRQQLENQWFDPSAFTANFGSDAALIKAVSTGFYANGTPVDFNALDAWWQFGNIGTRPPSGRMPGFWNSDMTLAKDLHLTESKISRISLGAL
jgi:hypothetical protein